MCVFVCVGDEYMELFFGRYRRQPILWFHTHTHTHTYSDSFDLTDDLYRG